MKKAAVVFIKREMTGTVEKLLESFPVVSVTGPRQSGKSTLLKKTFSDFKYINLEDPQLKKRASEDPVGFVRDQGIELIIDEAQLVPELFSMIQVVCDENNSNGQFILSGSQNFLLTKRIGQSLAGRVGLSKLMPFTFREVLNHDPLHNIDEFMFDGGYPRLYSENISKKLLFPNYIETYIERDVSDYLDVRNRHSFTQLLYLLAQNAGSLLNVSKLANNLDVSFQTIKSWLSILESSYIIFYLSPYHTNSKRRLTKAPKIYFWDTGLLTYLAGFQTKEELISDSSAGAIYENFVISEVAKNYLNKGVTPRMYFYRDDSKREIDLLDYTNPKNPRCCEIKSSRTYRDKFARQLLNVADELRIKKESRYVVCRVEESYNTSNTKVLTTEDWLLL